MARPMRHEKPKDLDGNSPASFPAICSRHIPLLLLIALLVVISAGANIFGTYLLSPAINDYILPGDIPSLIRMLAFMGAVYLQRRAVLRSVYSQLMVPCRPANRAGAAPGPV